MNPAAVWPAVECTWKLGEPEIYQDPERSQTLRDEQAQLTDEIEALYADWERSSGELSTIDQAIEQ